MDSRSHLNNETCRDEVELLAAYKERVKGVFCACMEDKMLILKNENEMLKKSRTSTSIQHTLQISHGNSTDKKEILVLHYIFTTFSIPIYGFAFWVLTFKCPPRFKAYRNLIVLQIFSGIVLEFHVGVIWKVSLPLPWATVCSHGLARQSCGNFRAEVEVDSALDRILLTFWPEITKFHGDKRISLVEVLKFSGKVIVLTKQQTIRTSHLEYIDRRASEYAVNCFQVFVALLVFNGITCLFLFFYRMENASKHTERSKLHMTTNFLKYLFYFMLLPTAVLTILVYPELDDQKEYKVKMERVYFLLKSDSMHSLVLLSGIWGTPFIYVIMIHLSLLFIPLTAYFTLALFSNLSTFSPKELSHFIIIMLQKHGSVSTFAMLMTNNLLKKAVKKTLSWS
ncbi:hypothetical protein CRE_18707 [Caenorhabditis remanei]|uniref:Uncharacterized protein n=1 Tax=Caenorhabditis remanei TaxID=31234 RepID=E3LLF5_CAERE|nr:hypothetical protein CRE_18707 [Caenorhabditis remanei]